MEELDQDLGAPVHYRSHGSMNGPFPPQCRAAWVTETRAGGVRSLIVANPTGDYRDDCAHDPGAGAGGTWHRQEECPHLPAPADGEVRLGELVHYRSYGSADGTHAPKCRAGWVTGVDSQGAHHIKVVTDKGDFYNKPGHDPAGSAPGKWHAVTECRGI